MRPIDEGSRTSAPRVEVRLAQPSERLLLEGLFQFYAYDFSEMEPAGSPAFEVDAEGRLPPYPQLAEYWSADGRWPLVIETDRVALGFALINTVSHRGGSIERNMAEFFLMRKHRRRGVATAAVHDILRRDPGRWEVAVAARNEVARRFWAKAIATAPNVSGVAVVEGDGRAWRGPIWCFRALAPGDATTRPAAGDSQDVNPFPIDGAS
jgi:predicted acetyltransferase